MSKLQVILSVDSLDALHWSAGDLARNFKFSFERYNSISVRHVKQLMKSFRHVQLLQLRMTIDIYIK
jgi:hypothetical protein